MTVVQQLLPLIGQILPVLTFLAGATLTPFFESRKDARQLRREVEAHERTRRAAALDRRDAFELENLLKLYAAISDLARAAGAAHHADSMISKETGQYAATQLPEGLSDSLYRTARSVRDLKGLVLDDEARQLVERAYAAIHRPSSLMKADPAEADAMFLEAILITDAAQAAIASRIRSIYGSSTEQRT